MADTQQWSIQELLRFLSTDAKVPLSLAMGYAKALNSEKLLSAKAIADIPKGGLDNIIEDEDHRKAIINAAKRSLKKSGDSPTKRKRSNDTEEQATTTKSRKTASKPTKEDFEKLIGEAELDIKKLEKITITINRAPFMLIFAMVHTVLVHGVSVASALSLSHSYISANAVSKGRSIGLIPEKPGDDITIRELLGGSSQPHINVMGREIAVLRQAEEGEYRAIDIHALKERRKKHGEATGRELYSNIPVYTPEAALGYVQRAFGKDLENVIGACFIALSSWLEGEEEGNTEEEIEVRRVELEKQGYNMYCQARPDVPYGQAGWGKKGELPLKRILDLRKKSSEEDAQDKRGKLSDEDGKQLSIEEAVADSEIKPKEPELSQNSEQDQEEDQQKDNSNAVRKARGTNKEKKGKQLALEETLDEEGRSAAVKRRSGRRK